MTTRREPSEVTLEAAVKMLGDLKPKRPRQDPWARVTACRWSAKKRRAVRPYDTLYRWILAMKQTAPGAWDVLTAAGVRVDGRSVRWRGVPCTGAQLAEILRETGKSPAIRAYTEATTVEALRRLAAVVVQPGGWGTRLVGAQVQPDGVAVFRRGRVRVGVSAPDAVSRVGGLVGAPDDFAMVVRYAVDAPDVLRAALWMLATDQIADRKQEARSALHQIASKLRQQLPTGRALPVPSYYGAAELRDRGLGEAVATLENLVWPTGALEVDMERLVDVVARLRSARRSPLPPTTAWTLAH